ncbi:hypothetical protein [Vibrio anguillarum]|uniref:Uncharacterized protein n=1 Tax=Vibrio anguillarum TaxID=55601 RepID=A0A7U6FS70_VIBAN|nr:hypothetical protein [Vibrio anguillarum]AZS26265.1 hypothetical protein DYL72_15260 [Vibrio anguillarum]MBF4374546.1 hypothetical protein [Vibrio anguillarum]
MKIEYQGEMISIYKLAKLSGCALTSLYRAYHLGIRSGDELVAEARKHLVEYNGEFITTRKLCSLTQSDYRKVKRRLNAGVTADNATLDRIDRRGATKAAKLSPSEVLNIYVWLFRKEKTQGVIATEFDIHPSTVSDIWRHKRWGWLTAPLRYELELTLDPDKAV